MYDAVDAARPPAGTGRRDQDRDCEARRPQPPRRAVSDERAVVRPSLLLRLVCRLIPEA
jgi:hypothetical protein